MTNLTDKQRAALTALRDVMKEHDISFTSSPSEFSRSIGVGRYLVFRTLSVNPIDQYALTELLEQETE